MNFLQKEMSSAMISFFCHENGGMILDITKGAVIKYGTEGGGRDLTGSAKLLDEKCWASEIFQVISMGHESICLQYFTIVLKRSSIIFTALLIISIFLHLNSITVLSSNSSLLS